MDGSLNFDIKYSFEPEIPWLARWTFGNKITWAPGFLKLSDLAHRIADHSILLSDKWDSDWLEMPNLQL